MLERLTVGQLKQVLKEYKVPDDAIITCQSDEEGNREMVCMEVYVNQVGRVDSFEYDGKEFNLVGGEDVEGIDQEADKGRYFITIRPMY